MGPLNDYLDALIPRPERGFGRLGTTPTLPAVQLRPVSLPALAPQVQSLLAIYSAADKARVDAQMWTLDQQWLGAASWADMRMCVTGRGDVAGGTVTTPYAGRGTCRTPTGAEAQPTCNWGFWRVDRCNLDTASQIFQIGRYLWAQSRMRDLLASKPDPSRVNDDVAAAWAWSAAQLISVLWWSTNVRFDNPNSAFAPAGDYAKALTSAGLLLRRTWTPWMRWDGGRTWAGMTSNNLGIAYDGEALSGDPYFVCYPLLPTAWNSIGYIRGAPTRQSDFNPGAGVLPFMDRTAPLPSRTYFYAGATPIYSNVPLGVPNDQVESIRQAAFAMQTAGDANAMSWTSTKAFNDWWFRATWSWPTMWRPLSGVVGRDGLRTKPVVLGGARVIVEDLARQLAFYSDPTKTYVAWMQSAMQTFNLETPIPPTSPAAIDFVNAKFSLMTSINNTASQAEATARTQTAAGTDAGATLIASTVLSLTQAIFSLVTQSVPVLGLIYSAVQQIENLIVAWAGGAIGNVPCPAFPFIRVMAPSSGACDLSTEQITSSLLGISTNARWPVAVGGQTRDFAVDGKTFTVTFAPTDVTADLVARRINAAAALVGLGAVATVRAGQVHVEGRDGVNPARATGGTACTLGLPGPCTPASTGSGGASPSKSSAVPWFVGGAVLLRLLLG